MPNFPVINMKKTGENIKKLMQERNYTVEFVQQSLGMGTKQSVYKWRQGATVPDIPVLLALSRLLGVEVADILVCDMPAAITPFSSRPAA